MTQQFTASEVRDAITWKYGDKLTRISAMLNAFADLLEAREIARNDAIEREYERENNPATPSDAKDAELWRYLVRENNKGVNGAFRIIWFDDREDICTTDGVSCDGRDDEAIVCIVRDAMAKEANNG